MEIVCIKSVRQKFFHAENGIHAMDITANYPRIGCKIGKHLSARPARKTRPGRIGNNHDGMYIPFAFRKRLENRRTFGTDRETVRTHFDITSGESFAGPHHNQSADLKFGIWRYGK